jgi:hypothetical protein
MTRHVLRSVKAAPSSLGGLSALRNVPWTVQEAFDFYAGDLRTTRVMVVDVRDGRVTILRDRTFTDRVDHPEEERRVARLDNVYDSTVHDVLWPECSDASCVHLEPARLP